MSDELKEVPFNEGHLDLIEIRELERDIVDVQRLRAYAQCGFCQTLIHEGRVLAISGLVELHPGTWEVYIIPSVYIESVGFVYVRWFRRKLDNLIKDLKAVRFQSAAIATEAGSKWMQTLGFELEGTMKKYANGDDYNLWARISDVAST